MTQNTAFDAIAVHRFYYLHNFNKALQWIQERYADILAPNELAFIEMFKELPEASQALAVRMMMRKGPWFRAAKLVYDEIPSLASAVQPLLALGWLSEDAPLSLEQLFALYTKPELVAVFARQGARTSMRKPELYELASSLGGGERRHSEWLESHFIDHAWRLNIGPISDRLRLMFFGNLYQDWSEFVLADLGIFKYETVDFDASSLTFRCSEDVDTYLRLYAWAEQLRGEHYSDELFVLLEEPTSNNDWLERRRQKLLFRLGQAAEKQREYESAHRAYAASTYPDARQRNIRVLEKLGRAEQALELAWQAVAQPVNSDEQQKVARMLPRLQRINGSPVKARKALSVEIAQLRFDLVLPQTLDSGGVEHALQVHWHSEQVPVLYVENALFNALFGLLFWDAIFAPVQGAFFHPFQSGPSDFGAPDFAQRREPWFNKGMQALSDGSYRKIIQDRFQEKQGTVSLFVSWGLITQEILDLALQCIPAAHLGMVFARMQSNVRNYRTGFPDLIRFWPQEQRYELIEAKAPGDKLQDNQILWLEYFVEHGIPAKIGRAHV